MGASCFKGQKEDEAQKGDATPRKTEAIAQRGSDQVAASGHTTCMPVLPSVASFNGCHRFSLQDLMLATDGFSESAIISEGGKQGVNVVYQGKLKLTGAGADSALRFTDVAVKRFSKREWEDSNQFLAEVSKISKVRHPNVTSLLGFCQDGHERILVSEFATNSTMAQHLFHWQRKAMPWDLRLSALVKVSSALEYLAVAASLEQYHDLNPYRILFDQEMNPKLSCFGLLKPSKEGKWSSNLSTTPPELLLSGVVTSQSVVYMLGCLLLAVLSGKSMRPTQFVEKVGRNQDLVEYLDSQLLATPKEVEQALELVPLISECFQAEPGRRPSIAQVARFLRLLLEKDKPESLLAEDESARSQEASRSTTISSTCSSQQKSMDSSAATTTVTTEGAGTTEAAAAPESAEAAEGPAGSQAGAAAGDRAISGSNLEMLRAAEEGDLEEIHRILLSMNSEEPKEAETVQDLERSVVPDALNWKREGNKHFQQAEWQDAIAQLTRYINSGAQCIPELFLRRGLSHMELGQWSRAREDAANAFKARPEWTDALCMEALALRQLGREEEAESIFSSVALHGML